MTRLTSGDLLIEISMRVWEGNGYTPDFSGDFFNVGLLPYDSEREAYIVKDVDYCIDEALDWEAGTEAYKNWNDETRDVVVDYVEED